jgi:outer membrane biosynthesis protein TonB
MSRKPADAFDLDDDKPAERPGQLSANAQWLFGSLYALLVLVGFSFGIWAGAQKPKPTELADAKLKENADKPIDKPAPKPVVTPTPTPEPAPTPPEPSPPEPKSKEPEPKTKEPEPKPKEVVKPPEVRAVAFKEVVPILRTYCFDCHGGSVGKPKGNVDLTSVAKMLRSKGPPLVPGKPNDSALYLSTKSGDMPPDGKKGPSQAELKVLHDWIASGAKERRRTVRVRRRVRSHDAREVELTAEAGAG